MTCKYCCAKCSTNNQSSLRKEIIATMDSCKRKYMLKLLQLTIKEIYLRGYKRGRNYQTVGVYK